MSLLPRSKKRKMSIVCQITVNLLFDDDSPLPKNTSQKNCFRKSFLFKMEQRMKNYCKN